MVLKCEVDSGDDGLSAAIAQSIRDLCKVRGEVEFVEPGAIANDGVVIEDIRQYE